MRPAAALAALATAALLAGLVWSLAAARAAEARFPASGRMVDAGGVPLRLLERGSGSPVVCVHGAWGGPEDFEATLFPLLEGRARMIALERPGHGWSGDTQPGAGTPIEQARVLRAALRTLGVERPLLVGFSYGGSVCAAWAAAWPGEIAGLVLVNPVLYPWEGIESASFAAASLPLAGELLVPAFAAPAGLLTASASLRKVFAPEEPNGSFERSPWTLALRPANFRANVRDLRRLKASCAIQSPLYPRISAPVRLLHGRGDLVAWPDYHTARFAREVATAQATFVDGAGHQLLHTRPRLVADAVLQLLDARR